MCKVKTIINNQVLNLEVEYKRIIKEEKVSDTYEKNEQDTFQENLIALYAFLGQAEDEEIELVVNNLVISPKQFCETVDDGTVRLENARIIMMSEGCDEFLVVDELNRIYHIQNF